MLGACLTCPLEVVKTRLQSKALSASHTGMLSIARGIAQTDGVRGFWKGIGPMLVGVVPARAVYFATYDFAKGFLNARRPEGASTHLLSAMCAGSATNIMINPVWVSRIAVL
jgi:solute carrier family 25, member 33/36